MDDAAGCLGYLIVIVAFFAVIAFIVMVLVQVAFVIGAVMGIAGIGYGGGLACKNYGLAFKHNVIESNKA